MRQGKGREVTILDRKDYIEKCMSILDTKQFRKLSKDPTKTLERKMQRVLRKTKYCLEGKNARICTHQDKNRDYFMVQQNCIS